MGVLTLLTTLPERLMTVMVSPTPIVRYSERDLHDVLQAVLGAFARSWNVGRRSGAVLGRQVPTFNEAVKLQGQCSDTARTASFAW